MQPECVPLAERLLAAGFTVMIETSGERLIAALRRSVVNCVDVKCPDSGEPDTFDFANLEALDGKDEVKCVLATRREEHEQREILGERGERGRRRAARGIERGRSAEAALHRSRLRREPERCERKRGHEPERRADDRQHKPLAALLALTAAACAARQRWLLA